MVSIRSLTRFNQFSQLNRFNHIQHSDVSISTLVEFKSFKIYYSIKKRTMMNDTEEIILLTLILRRRRRIYHTRTYYTKTSTQPPLAQSSKNISHRHLIKPPQHLFTTLFSTPSFPVELPQTRFPNHQMLDLLVLKQVSGTFLCTSLQLQILCTRSVPTPHIYSTSSIICYSWHNVWGEDPANGVRQGNLELTLLLIPLINTWNKKMKSWNHPASSFPLVTTGTKKVNIYIFPFWLTCFLSSLFSFIYFFYKLNIKQKKAPAGNILKNIGDLEYQNFLISNLKF